MNIRGLLKTSKKARIWVVGSVLFLLLAGLSATDIPLRAEIGAIHFYQAHVSPLSSNFITCRFSPT